MCCHPRACHHHRQRTGAARATRRETYLRVAKTLTAARGKWDRKPRPCVPLRPARTHGRAVETGAVVDAKKTLQFFETRPPWPGAWSTSPRSRRNSALNLAGTGRIVRELLAARAEVRAVEVEPANAAALRAIGATACCTSTR